MKKLPWSSITSGLVRNFLTFGASCAAALPTIASSRIAGKKRQMILMESSSSLGGTLIDDGSMTDRCRAFVDHTPIVERNARRRGARRRGASWDTRLMRTKQQHFAGRVVRCAAITVMAAMATPAFAQVDVQAAVLKHLKTSRDFT